MAGQSGPNHPRPGETPDQTRPVLTRPDSRLRLAPGHVRPDPHSSLDSQSLRLRRRDQTRPYEAIWFNASTKQ
eukprot:11214873-Lingulodinium_polyedra.AAC.1